MKKAFFDLDLTGKRSGVETEAAQHIVGPGCLRAHEFFPFSVLGMSTPPYASTTGEKSLSKANWAAPGGGNGTGGSLGLMVMARP